VGVSLPGGVKLFFDTATMSTAAFFAHDWLRVLSKPRKVGHDGEPRLAYRKRQGCEL